MIGVICADREKPAVREFFQLFKTPWMFWEPGRPFDVLIVTSAATLSGSFTARLVIAFGTVEMRDDASLGVCPRWRTHNDLLEVGNLKLPLYTGALTLAGDATMLGRSASSGAALIVERVTSSSRIIRCGYDLFSEVGFLLSAGQPPERAGTPTLDLHIALIRQWIVAAGIPLWEIPPVPPGHQFLACLTHDVDFLGIRRHRLDRTLAGFLLRGFGRQPARVHPRPSLTQTATEELGRTALAPVRLRRSAAGFLAPVRSLHQSGRRVPFHILLDPVPGPARPRARWPG